MLKRVTDYRQMGHLSVMDMASLDDTTEICIEHENEIEIKELSNCPVIKEFYLKSLNQGNQCVSDGLMNDIFSKYKFNKLKMARYIVNKNTGKSLIEAQNISNDIGYINFLSFSFNGKKEVEKYNKEVQEILHNFKDKKHLILDLRSNIGGFELAWQDAFVRNIITTPVACTTLFATNFEDRYIKVAYERFKNSYFVEGIPTHYFTDDKSVSLSHDISNKSEFKALKFNQKNREDKKNFNSIVYKTSAIEPSENPIAFEGKIWILISEKTASAAESFAFFMRGANLMSDDGKIPVTIVGKSSRGMFYGYDRIYLKLPNSGLVIKSDFGYALNPDGSCVVEEGINPDTDSGVIDALGKCRLLIKKEQESEDE